MTATALAPEDAGRLEQCVAAGGVAVFPTDTVYGLCCDPDSEQAARRMYALKGRPSRRASAVLYFSLAPALEMLDDLHERERAALQALLPGGVTLLLANRGGRFAPACRTDPATFGLRVPRLPEHLVALGSVRALCEGADVVLDGGELRGVPSTVVDLRDFAQEGRWYVLREGAVGKDAVAQRLASL